LLPGFPWKVETVTGEDPGAGTSHPVAMVLYQSDGSCQDFVIGERQDFEFLPGATDTFNVSF